MNPRPIIKTHWKASEDPMQHGLGDLVRIVFRPSARHFKIGPRSKESSAGQSGLEKIAPRRDIKVTSASASESQMTSYRAYELAHDPFWSVFSGADIGSFSLKVQELREFADCIEYHYKDGSFYSIRGAHRLENLPHFLNPQFYLQKCHFDWREIAAKKVAPFLDFVALERLPIDLDTQKTVLVVLEILTWALIRSQECKDLQVVWCEPESGDSHGSVDLRSVWPLQGFDFCADLPMLATLSSHAELVGEHHDVSAVLRIWEMSQESLHLESQNHMLQFLPARKWRELGAFADSSHLLEPTDAEREVLPEAGKDWHSKSFIQLKDQALALQKWAHLSEILGPQSLHWVHKVTVGEDTLKPFLHVKQEKGSVLVRWEMRAETEGMRIFNFPRSWKSLAKLAQGGISEYMHVDRLTASSKQARFRQNDLSLFRHQGLGLVLLMEMVQWLLGMPQSDGVLLKPREGEDSEEQKFAQFLTYAKALVPAVVGKSEDDFDDMYSPHVRKIFEDFLRRMKASLISSEEYIFHDNGIVHLAQWGLNVLKALRAVLLIFVEESSGKIISQSKSAFHEHLADFLKHGTDPSISLDPDVNHWDNSFELKVEKPMLSLVATFYDLIEENVSVLLNGQALDALENPFQFDFTLAEGSSELEGSWFDLHPQVFFNGELIDSQEIQVDDKTGFVEYRGKIYRIDKKAIPSFKALNNFWKKIRGRHQVVARASFGARVFRLPRSQTLELLMLRSQGIAIRGGPEWQRICDFFDKGLGQTSVSVSEKTQSMLLPHQTVGAQWLYDLYQLRLGAILADEMGLGKTFQTLAFLEAVAKEGGLGRCLIVVPTSLVYNWMEEKRKFSEALPFKIYQSSDKENIKTELMASQSQVLLTTYGMLNENPDFFQSIHWNIVIFDEAQSLKTITSQRSVNSRKLKAQFKICLTGTPMENNYLEFYSLSDLVVSGCLGGVDEFRREYLAENVSRDSVERLRMLMKPLMLRRTKSQVDLRLPEKTIQKTTLPFERHQKEIYKKMALSYSNQIDELVKTQGESRAQIAMLTALMRLRQICSDPRAVPGVEYTEVPAKVQHLMESVVEHLENGDSVIIFTQFLSTLDRIEKKLAKRGIPHFVLHGQVPGKERLNIIDRFQNSDLPGVMLMTLKTGGVGLNLTKASVVYHLEPWWNPAVENQATDRAHRMGQMKAVQVFNLLMEGSLEERITELKLKKQKSFDVLFGEGEDLVVSDKAASSALTQQDFHYLLNSGE